MECRYFQASDSHVYVNEGNQYNPVDYYNDQARQEHAKVTNDGDHNNIFDTNFNSYYLATSNGFTDNARQNDEDIHTLIKQQYSDISERIISSEHISKKNILSSCNLSTRPNRKACGTPSCNSVPKMSWQEKWNNYKNNKRFSSDNIYNEQVLNEKSTYVRPLHDTFTENFVYKALQRNKRLQTIVKNLVYERQREKRERPREAWNNYINELKNRHGYYSNELTTIIPQYEPEEEQSPELFDDYYNSSYNWQYCTRSQNLLDGFDQAYRNMQHNDYCNKYSNKYDIPYPRHKLHNDNNYYCYPTSSQGSLLMMGNRERLNNNLDASHLKRHANLNPKVIDKRINKLKTSHKFTKSSGTLKDNINNSKHAQTKLNHSCFGSVGVGTKIVNKETNKKVQLSSIVAEPKQMCKITPQYSKIKQPEKVFDNMERKLDVLIDSVNVFIEELRQNQLTKQFKNHHSKSQSLCCMLSDISSTTKTDIFGIKCDIGTSTCHFREPSTSKIDRIIQDEKKTSLKIKRDIDELLHTKCSRKFDATFDKPTKEVCSAATSFSADIYIQNKLQQISNTVRSEGKLMTIAVNTEPLGLLALLKVSMDTLKQLLSYMPALSCSSYLPVSRTPLQLSEERYICNVCHASFKHPVQLSNHIRNHNLGSPRDCCVCRHVRRLQGNFYGAFDCKYCGESFTRAYCRELHQSTCCKRSGYEPEPINPNLLLLK